ncbi:uncharacterized protein LOC143604092 [Bidens hawaiensis]|uniref:uncharacterized protein LOC143604092 n=1 Tax=Bidens hawaiensis TaxID=980011 RepID=UPI00404962E7
MRWRIMSCGSGMFLVLSCNVAVVYVFIMSLPQNGLWIPTVLIFLTGMIKYIERSRALYLASVDKFKYSMLKEADAGKNYTKLMDELSNMKKANLPAKVEVISEKDAMAKSTIKANKGGLKNLDIIWFGHQFFKKYVGLYVDMIFNLKEWNETRKFFLDRTARDPFRVVEVELNFMYEVLFTKLRVVYTTFGAISRIFSLTGVCLAFVLFALKSKSKFRDTNVMITYALLIGALALDISALIMLFFSDWTIIHLKKKVDGAPHNSLKIKMIRALLRLLTEGTEKPSRYSQMQVINRSRWSKTIPSYNLIDYCLHPLKKPWIDIVDVLGLTGYLDSIVYVKWMKFDRELRDFIFKELKSKAKESADDLTIAKELSSSRGDWVLETQGCWDSLVKYISDVDYNQSLIQWHVATEICYNCDLADKGEATEEMKISKLLSDYMLYLLFMQSSLMSGVAGVGQIRFLDDCAEICAQVKRISDNEKYMVSVGETVRGRDKQMIVCQGIRNASAELNSMLFESCSLAEELLKKENRWEIISKVWVEMLCYAASHTPANMQVAQVSKGGELITIIWLLMTHFGLGDQFQHNKRKTAAQLFVGK